SAARIPPTATSPPQAASRPVKPALASSEAASPADLAALKDAITAARRGKAAQASDLQQTISDPVARRLVEWAILRSDETESVSLSRYTAFIHANPAWPAIALLRRRAEGTLWSDRPDPSVVRASF